MTKTHRTVELYAPVSEAEALAIEAELRDHDIAPVLVRAASIAPGIADPARWGTIRVPEEELERAQEVVAAWLEDDDEDLDEEELERQAIEAEEDDSARREELAAIDGGYRGVAEEPKRRVPHATPVRSMPVSAVIAAVSIALNVGLGGWLYFVVRTPSPGGTTRDYDSDDRLIAEWRYEVGKRYPTRARYYDVDGVRTVESIDRDGDGRNERTLAYDRAGLVLSLWTDADENDWSERFETLDVDERVSTVWFDRDDDGRHDEIRVPPRRGREALVLRDLEQDGFFETLECGSERREIRCP